MVSSCSDPTTYSRPVRRCVPRSVAVPSASSTVTPDRRRGVRHHVGAALAAEVVVAAAAVDDVVAGQAADDVVAGRAREDVGPGRADDRALVVVDDRDDPLTVGDADWCGHRRDDADGERLVGLGEQVAADGDGHRLAPGDRSA